MTRLKLLGWKYPEWWTVALAVIAWIAIVENFARMENATHIHSAMGVGHRRPLGSIGIYDWFLMVVAMMFPTMIGPARGTAVRSLWRRRHRAIGVMLLGYVGVWTLVGLVILPILAASGLNGSRAGIAAGFAAAALWQASPVKNWALRHCHRSMPLAAHGWKAEMDCLCYGCAIGGYCVGSCGVLMLACSHAGHNIMTMLGGTAVVVSERYLPRVPPIAIVIAVWAIAGSYAVVAIL